MADVRPGDLRELVGVGGIELKFNFWPAEIIAAGQAAWMPPVMEGLLLTKYCSAVFWPVFSRSFP